MRTDKAGCILINPKDKLVALVYRESLDDYSFPKGHVEANESLIECAIRETNEETKRDVIILKNDPIGYQEYTTSSDESIRVYYYLCKDNGVSDNKSLETHPVVWVAYNDVYDKLTYDDSKAFWNSIKDEVANYFD